jgi:hypothetical protein
MGIFMTPSDRAMWRERMKEVANTAQSANLPCIAVADWYCDTCPADDEIENCRKSAAAYLEHDKEG